MSTTYDAIQAVNQQFKDAFKRGNAAGVAACYTHNAQLLPPGAPLLAGQTAIAEFWQGAMNLGIKEASLETKQIEERGNLATELGQYTLTIQPVEGERLTEVGKYVVVWLNEGGTWKLHFDIWNANAAG
jgi:uncharacterized protein (TIGR02246 family)